MRGRGSVAAGCLLLTLGLPVPVVAEPTDSVVTPDPAASPAPAPPPDTGVVASAPPAVAQTAEGRTLTVSAENETQLPVPPLTTSLSSRDWLVGATFVGNTAGSAGGGTMEVGYQIGCGIEMNQIRLGGTMGASVNASSIAFPVSGVVDVRARPGTVTTAVVMKKDFKGTKTRIIVKDIHIRVDGCVGASTLRSYALLTSSTAHTEDIVAYYGLPKVF